MAVEKSDNELAEAPRGSRAAYSNVSASHPFAVDASEGVEPSGHPWSRPDAGARSQAPNSPTLSPSFTPARSDHTDPASTVGFFFHDNNELVQEIRAMNRPAQGDVLKEASEVGLDEFIEARLLERKEKELDAREAHLQRLERELEAKMMALDAEKEKVLALRERELQVQQEFSEREKTTPLSHAILEDSAAPQARLEPAPDDATQQTMSHHNAAIPPKQQGAPEIGHRASQHLEPASEPDIQERLPIKGGGGMWWRKLRNARRAILGLQDTQLGVAKDKLSRDHGQGEEETPEERLRLSSDEGHRDGNQRDQHAHQLGDEIRKQQASEREQAGQDRRVQVQEELSQGQQEQLHSMPNDPASAQVKLESASDASQHTTDSHKTSDNTALSPKWVPETEVPSAATGDMLPESMDVGALIQNDQDDSFTCDRSGSSKDGDEEAESGQQGDTNFKDMTPLAKTDGDTEKLPKEKFRNMGKLRKTANEFSIIELLDNRIYRDEVSSTIGISNEVVPFDNALDDPLLKTRANGNSESQQSSSRARQNEKRTQNLRPCLKAVSSYGPGNVLIHLDDRTHNRRDLQKRQRVRFYLPKKSRGLGRFFAVFEPDSAVVGAWSTFLVLPMAYELWAGAFRLALGTPQQEWLYMLDLISDGCFVADGMIQLNTAIKHNHDGIGGISRSSDTLLLIRSRRSIAIQYFTNGFPFLVLSSVVYHTGTWMSVEEDAEKQDPNLWLWWISSLPRLVFRVRYLLHFFKAMDMNLNVAVSSMQIVKFVLMIFMSAHWIGSLSFFAARVQPAGNPTWLDSLPPVFPMFERESAFFTARSLSNYILCLYKGVDGLVSIGYFPMVPTNTIEMILALSVQYLAILVTAYILGSLFHYLLVSQKDALKEEHTKKMQNLEYFMEDRHLPMPTRRRLEQYFEFQYKKQVQRKSSAALKLPRSLEVKVANARFSPTLLKCCNRGVGKERGPFFGCSPQFLNAMVTKLRPVFLMPGDQFMRSSDMVLELCFVSTGWAEVMEGENVKRSIRSDVDTPSIVGELSFFLGVQQQHSVRAPESSDIELLVLSKEHSEELFKDYPEQQEIITSNLLSKYNLDSSGKDLEHEAGDDDEDPDAQAMRSILRETVKRRHDEAFQALAWAATSGDTEELRRMLRKNVGIIAAANYDGKTVLHMAAVEGNYRVVELLLQEGVDKNKHDRWGNTALQDAIIHNQGPVIQLLVQWNSELNADNVAGRLCDAASAGDLDTLKLILDHSVDPNVGDYDARTPLHLAAAEGQDKAVQYLIAKGADVNAKDRWGATPLQDAVQSGHLQVAEQLLSRNGVMVLELGPAAMCNAATQGDVRYLRLLVRCGVNPDIGDYDFRCPLHLAAAEGRLLAVSYLLSISSDPNAEDRWGGTPMDDCVRGATQRHMQCAKLLQCMGGVLGTLASTTEGREALMTIDAIEMGDVRKVVKLLINQGLDSKKPERATHQECIIAFEASMELLGRVQETSRLFEGVTPLLLEEQANSRQLLDAITDACRQIAGFEGLVVAAHERKTQAVEQGRSPVVKLATERAEALEAEVDQFVQLLHSTEPAGLLDCFFDSVIDATTIAQYDELDVIQSEQEHLKFASKSQRMLLAKHINRFLMNLFKVDEMWRVLQLGFHDETSPSRFPGPESLPAILSSFDMHITKEQAASIFKEATEHGFVSVENVLVHSSTFQNLMLQDDKDDVAQLLYRSAYLRVLSWKSMKFLCRYARRVNLRPGHAIRLRERSIIAMQSGSARITYSVEASESTQSHDYAPYRQHTGSKVFCSAELERNQVAGEAWAVFDIAQVVSLRAHENTAIILLPHSAIGALLESHPALFRALCSNLVDLTFDMNTGKAIRAPGSLQPFEVDMIYNLYTNTRTNKKKTKDLMVLTEAPLLHNIAGTADRAKFELERCFAVRSLMEACRKSMHMEWSDSDLKPAIIALCMWRNSYESRLASTTFQSAEHERRTILREGFQIIEGAWSVLTDGVNMIHRTHLESLKEHLGEVGVHFFQEAFHAEHTAEELDFEGWVACWLRYLDDKDKEPSVRGDPLQASHAMHGAEYAAYVPHETKKSRPWLVQMMIGTYQRLTHTPITPLLGHDDILLSYEPSYIAFTGDSTQVLKRSRVKDFLALLLIDYDKPLNDRHVSEFMAYFSPDGPNGLELYWIDIERVLRERSNESQRADRLFLNGLGSPLNPNSLLLRTWRTLMQMSALYYFTHVPVRIAFDPYPEMLGWQYALLSVDLGVDCLVFLNLLLTFNIGYMNKKSRWVIDRGKIARHYLASEFWIDLLCAFPTDWVGFLNGLSQRRSSFARILKMIFVYTCFRETRPGLIGIRQVGSMTKLIIYIWMLLHVASCLLFVLGNERPANTWTWYRAPVNDGNEVQTFEYMGFGSAEDPDDSPWYRIWKQYCLSFYWVTTTVTSTGIIGDMHPKNYQEVIFTMAMLIINLTLFQYVIGQVSAQVLKGDEKLLKAREELGAVESYLQSFEFSEDIRRDIRAYFQGNGESAHSVDEIFNSVSQTLRLEMSSELTRKCLDDCELFLGCSVQLKNSIRGLLREVHFGREEYLCQINTVAHDILFIMRGKVERLNNDEDGNETVEARIGAGGAVGVIAAYYGIRYMYSARATSCGPCMCLRLVRNQLMPILKAYPDDEEVVAQNAMLEFQKAKREKSIHGNSTRGGRSVKSGARSVASERKIVKDRILVVTQSDNDDGSDRSLKTAYEDEADDQGEQDVNAIIISGIEAKLQHLNKRRKTEKIAQFCNAASRGDLQKLHRLMRSGLHVDETDVNGRTALHCAASEGQLETVQHLIEARASINVKDNYKNTPLNDAVRHKFDSVALELRENGCLPITLPGYEMGVQMCAFAFEGNQDQLHRMIINGVDVNIADYDNRTALHLAASEGHVDIVSFLIAHQADVNACDRMGFSPLVDALRHNQLQVQKVLRAHGGQLLGMDVSVELCEAASKGDVPRMKAMIDNGSNPNAGDYDDRTALHLAASNGQTAVLYYLLHQLDAQINVNPIDRLGGTPTEDAYRHGKSVAVAILEEMGGLRQDDPKLLAMEEVTLAEAEVISHQSRAGKVKDLGENSPELKTFKWVAGRCGKILPKQMKEIKETSTELREAFVAITKGIAKFLDVAKIQDGLSYNAMRQTQEYKEVVKRARELRVVVRQWRDQTTMASAVLSEDLPACRAALIRSREFCMESEKLVATFTYVGKALQYWRSLVSKIPDLLEEAPEFQNEEAA